MTISEKIFYLLKQKDMTQRELSVRTGISTSTINDWKKKNVIPGADKIMQICIALEVSPYTLLSETMNLNEKEMDYIMVSKDSDDFRLLSCFHGLSEKQKERLIGYLEFRKIVGE